MYVLGAEIKVKVIQANYSGLRDALVMFEMDVIADEIERESTCHITFKVRA